MVVPFKEAVVDPTLPYLSSLDGKMKAVINSSLKPDEKIKQYNYLLDNFRLGVPERREEAEETVEEPAVKKPRRFTVYMRRPSFKNISKKTQQNSAADEAIPEPVEEDEWADEVSDLKKKKLEALRAREQARQEKLQKAREARKQEKLQKAREAQNQQKSQQTILKNLSTGGNFEASLANLPATRSRQPTQWYSQTYTN